MRGADEIAPDDARVGGVTSHSIGIEELARLLDAVPADAEAESYDHVVLHENVLGLATENGRRNRLRTLKRFYLLRPDAVLFRCLRDLWPMAEEGRPLLAGLCALATDPVFRATAPTIIGTPPGASVAVGSLRPAIEASFPGVYAASTVTKAADNAYASWQQTGHLAPPSQKQKARQTPACEPADVAFALVLGHLTGATGEALFDTIWTRVLDRGTSHLYDLAFAASRQSMLEFRSAGGVVEVGFRQLLRPLEGELL